MAVDINRFLGIQLRQTLPQLIQWNVHAALEMPLGVLPLRAGIQKRDLPFAALLLQFFQILPVELFQQTAADIADHETSHVHRVFGRGVGRRVGQIQLL